MAHVVPLGVSQAATMTRYYPHGAVETLFTCIVVPPSVSSSVETRAAACLPAVLMP